MNLCTIVMSLAGIHQPTREICDPFAKGNMESAAVSCYTLDKITVK